MGLRVNMERYYTKQELQHYMKNPDDVELLAEKHNLGLQWQHWLDESEGMTLKEIVEDFFYHFDLVEWE